MVSSSKKRCRHVLLYWRQLVVITAPIVLLPLVLLESSDEKTKCAYTLLVMAIYWSTEAIPLAVTSLIPAVLFPLLGTMKTSAVAAEYTKNTILMNIGSITMATSFEKCNLHRRVALGTMSLIGTEPRWLMLSFMLPTWFLSMWISNTSTTALMIPLLESVLLELEKNKPVLQNPKLEEESLQETQNHAENEVLQGAADAYTIDVEKDIRLEKSQNLASNLQKTSEYISTNYKKTAYEIEPQSEDSDNNNSLRPTIEPESESSKNTAFAKGLVLCVAYSANIGGISTVTGSGTNIVMQGFSEEIWGENNLISPVTFSSWMVFGLPLSVLLFFLLWIVLQLFFVGFCKKNHNKEEFKARNLSTRQIIKDELRKLGPFTFAEGAVSILFVAMVLLWFFRVPSFMSGWATYFKQGYVGGSVPALIVAVLVYVIPINAPWKTPKLKGGRIDTLMDWDYFNRKMPWRVILILGGGFALARGVIDSGLGDWLGEMLTSGPPIPGWVMVLCLSLLASTLTEFTSNSATCTLLMPIVANMAERLGMNPLYFMFPVSISTSFSFMLPVGTPPNTLAHATGRVAILDMCKTGLALNINKCTLCYHGYTYLGISLFRFQHDALAS